MAQDAPVVEPLVVLEGVNKHFGDLHVLRDIDLTIGRGEVVAVIGPSGSGKSTLCRAINRLESIDSGTITIDGRRLPDDGRELARLRAEVGMVFQQFNLFAHKTILENVTLGPTRVRRLDQATADRHALELLAHSGMTMLVVTHEMGFARRASDRVVFMADGEIVEQAPPEQFFTGPRSERAREFLAKVLSH